MIDTDEYIEMWDDNLLGSEGVQILMNTLIAEVKRLRGVIVRVWDLMQNSNHQDREAYFWGFDGKNTGWMKVHEELAMRELNWGEEE